MNYLEHHGILGQKWGIRRYQNADGTLTAAGKLRYGVNDSRYSKQINTEWSKRKTTLVNNYQKQGASRKEAIRLADGRIHAEKVIAITAGVTLGAFATYALIKSGKKHAGKIIKEGQELYRVTRNKSGELHDVFYAAGNKRDNNKYINAYGKQLKDAQKWTLFPKKFKLYNLTLTANKDLKIASDKEARKVFKELKKTNPRFDSYGQYKSYAKFNILGMNNSMGDAVSRKIFVEEMKKRGFDGINDLNDQWLSGYNANTATIFFNGPSAFSTLKIDDVTNNLSNKKSFYKALLNMGIDGIDNPANVAIGSSVAYALGLNTLNTTHPLYYDQAKLVESRRKGRNKL